MKKQYMRVADLVNHSDPHRRTWRQINADKKHDIPVGTLVGLDNGVRMFVVFHGRDCDMTPLYYLSADPTDTERRVAGLRNAGWSGGYSRGSLTIVE